MSAEDCAVTVQGCCLQICCRKCCFHALFCFFLSCGRLQAHGLAKLDYPSKIAHQFVERA